MTLDFIMAMLEYFKQQKKIHRRFAFQIVLEVSGACICRVSVITNIHQQTGNYPKLLGAADFLHLPVAAKNGWVLSRA